MSGYTPISVQTIPFVGDYFRIRNGQVFQAMKTNPKNCVSRDKSGATYNVPYAMITETGIEDQGWETPEVPRVGAVIRIKADSGMFRKSWFKQYSPHTLFVVVKSEAAKVHFAPLGGEGMPEHTVGYSVRPSGCVAVNIDISSIVVL